MLNRGVTVTQKVTMGVFTSAQMIYEAILGIGTREQIEQTKQMGKTEQTDLTEQTEQAADFAAASGVQKEQTKKHRADEVEFSAANKCTLSRPAVNQLCN